MSTTIKSIEIAIAGTQIGFCSRYKIGSDAYVISDYSLSQELLSPTVLNFSLHKQKPQERDGDVSFDACSFLIGKPVELHTHTETLLGNKEEDNQLHFKGIIVNTSASRGYDGHYTLHVAACSPDYLLNDNANCRSFLNKTLKAIVEEVLAPYQESLQASVQPRFEGEIPYTVQYNESNYAFLVSLARRYGEWLYFDGKQLVFGSISLEEEKTLELKFPKVNLSDYGIDMQIRPFNFSHIAPNHYKYGKEEGYRNKAGAEEAEKNLNKLNEASYIASTQLFKAKTIQYLNAASFDDGEDEGTETILDFSTKVQARGQKAQMFTCRGSSKVSELQIGKKIRISDQVVLENNRSEEIKQEEMMIIDISHHFDNSLEYSNSFRAIPSKCDYPPYASGDVFPYSAPQRATVVDNLDPQKLGRVKVQFAWQAAQNPEMTTPWLRISQPYGGLRKGVQFIPEIGEEVMVGFEMNNAERPYIMGTLFNGRDFPDEDWLNDAHPNDIKAIRTRSGHTIEFVDSADAGFIRIYDYQKDNYVVTLSTDQQLIKIESKGNIELYAGKTIRMRAEKDIELEAGENISIESGKDTDMNAGANMSVTVKNTLDQKAEDIYTHASNNLEEQSGKAHTVMTQELKQKASGNAVLDGGSQIEITAGNVKIR